MRPKLIVIFLLIVLAPMGLLAWLGVRLARNEQEIVENRIQELVTGMLRDADAIIAELISERERQCLRIADRVSGDAAAIREIVRKGPAISEIFMLGPDGKRVYPPIDGPLNTNERAFLERAGQIWKDKQVFFRKAETGGASQAPTSRPSRGIKESFQGMAASTSAGPSTSPLSAQGWYVWYWGSGVNLAFWRRDNAGTVIGIELDRVRLLSDIVAKLPGVEPGRPALPAGRIRLVDTNGAVLYQWGLYEPGKNERPAAEMAVCYPLNSWKLEYFGPNAALGVPLGRGVLFNLVAGLAAVGIALAGLAAYFYRESSREMREAAQRVSFVNQASHELKTPLTNIRMYAELLEQQVAENDEKTKRYLGVVISESQRLSRLIKNVLTFSRRQRGRLSLRMGAGRVDDLIASVIGTFRPALEAGGVAIEFSGKAEARVQLDADALEQILGNLFNNVEKYAASGGLMAVASRQEGDRTTIMVSDRGPGIPKDQKEKIFQPFHRLSNKPSDGVTGTGIGLSIARDLARLHGGDLALAPSEQGACFELTLRTPPAEEERTE